MLESNKKMQKIVKNCQKIFFCFKQSVTHVSIFQGLFKKIVFRSVALVTKKLWAILDFFIQTGLFTALYPTLCIKTKCVLQKILSLNVTVILSKLRVLGQKKMEEGAANAPPPLSLFRVKRNKFKF